MTRFAVIRIVLLAALLSCKAHLPAQEIRIDQIIQKRVRFDVLGIDEGLSQGMILHALEGHDGYIWIATKEGLNRYDGREVKVFRHDPDDPRSIAENSIVYLHIDGANRLWISTQSKGLDLYDPETETFIHFKNQPGKPNNLRTDFPDWTFSNPEGKIFVMARDTFLALHVIKPATHGNDFTRFDISTFREEYPALYQGGLNWIEKEYNNALTVNNDVYGYSADGTFWCFDKVDSIYAFSPAALKGKEKRRGYYADTNSPLAPSTYIRTLVFDHDRKNVYKREGTRQLMRYDFRTKQFAPYLIIPEGYSLNGEITFNRAGEIYCASLEKILIRIDPVSRTLTEYIPANEIPYSSANECPFEDAYGNIWLPTGGYGLGKVSARSALFNQHKGGAEFNYQFTTWLHRTIAPGYNSLYETESEHLFKHTKNKKFLALIKNSEHSTTRKVVRDEEGWYWFSIRSRHRNNFIDQIVRVNLKGQELEVMYEKTDQPNNSVLGSALFFDRNGDFWFSSKDDNIAAHLNHLDRYTGLVTQHQLPIHPGPFHYSLISDFWQQNNGVFWLATTKGLLSFNPGNAQWKHYSESRNSSHLSNDLTLSICPDPYQPEKILWIGTEGGGLNKFDIQTEQFTTFTTQNGLPNNVIYGILADEKNNLWLSTNRGLCLFNPHTLEVRNFTSLDGINGNEFNRYEYGKAADGTLYFGGVNGGTSFHPNDFYTSSKPSHLIINGLKLANQPIEYSHESRQEGKSGFQLTCPIELCNQLIFDYGERMLSLSFSLLDFTAPEQNRYKYRLIGSDDNWIEAGNSNQATYTNLSPGEYTFEVMGCNSSNVWSTEPTRLELIILPPWWGTWWFRLLSFLFIISIFYGLYRYRLAHHIGMERMRNRIAQDLHDEIGSTLSSISLYSAVMQKTSGDLPQKTNDILGKIIGSTSDIMEKMNDMVWTIKSDNDNFDQVIHRMRAFAAHMAETKDIQLTFNADDSLENLQLPMDKRKNIYLIFKEAINNAVKYSQCDVLSVSIIHQKQLLSIEISDNGIGFEPEKQRNQRELLGGNGIASMTQRAKELKATLDLHSAPGNGTNVRLTLHTNH